MPRRLRALARRAARAFDPAYADESLMAGIRARQLQAVLRLTPFMMAANVLSAALVWWVFRDSGVRLWLGGWVLLVLGTSVLGLRGWLRGRSAPPRAGASRHAMQRATQHAAALSLLWATVPLGLFGIADEPRQLFVGTVTAGMMCAGGFALATLPAAGVTWVLVLGAAASVALWRSAFPLAAEVGVMLVVYTLTVIASVLLTSRLFVARLRAEADAERHGEVVGLLLRDFEEHASDVLWEVDGRGHFCHVSPRLVAIFGVAAQRLAAAPALAWLERMQRSLDPGQRGALDALREHVRAGTAFRDLVVALRWRTGNVRWWSLSAKPLLDAHARVTGWRGVAADVTETQRATEQLRYLALFDPLTGLANRHQFRARLGELLATASFRAAVLYLDLDHFKSVNDTMGHAVGDRLLQAVAQRLRGATREHDVVARLSGDEFALILRGVADDGEAALLTQRLQAALNKPCDIDGRIISVSSSIGVALTPRDATQIDPLLGHADLALYAAKAAGRGSFRFYSAPMASQARRRIDIERALATALERSEMSLVFQPQVDLRSRDVRGFEALLRWRHPELGSIAPAEFIAVAEESGQVPALGAWAMREACRHARGWPPQLHVSVNVSPLQLLSAELPAQVQRALVDAALPARQLELEITESVFLSDMLQAQAALQALTQVGVRIALDDFGAGYSSLAYLRGFAFHTLKIDSAFVRELMARRDARAIVKAIIDLAGTLHIHTVAEGVEEPAQVDLLARYGCEAVQGYFVARPLTADQVMPFLADWSSRPRVAMPAWASAVPVQRPH